jgi:hypothetical protein
MTRNDEAELTAMRACEILCITPEQVSEQQWDKLCLLYGGRHLPASVGKPRRMAEIERSAIEEG